MGAGFSKLPERACLGHGRGVASAKESPMSLYSKYFLPYFLDLALRNREAVRLRRKWIPRACGRVLEVGIGSGLNLPFYSREVERVWGADPSPELLRMARRRTSQLPFEVEFLPQSAEAVLPIDSAVADTVVITWSLCSIENPLAALYEARRVLKPGGQLVFVEHGRSPDARVAVWQDRLTPVWRRLVGGCTLNRPIGELVTGAGFRLSELTTGYIPGPRPMTYMYEGSARIA
jgi:SAM-dependent methyltransferase